MSYFLLKSHRSRRCLDTTGRHNNGQEVHQWDCDHNNTNQQWVMNDKGQIKHRHSNKCLDSNKRENGARFYLWDCNGRGHANQKFVHHSTAVYFDKGLCMDNTGATGNGTKVHMWQCNPDNVNQKWDKLFKKTTTKITASKPKDQKLSTSDKCKEFPNKFKNEMNKVTNSVSGAIVNALKKVGTEINNKLGEVIQPIKDEIISKFSEFFIAITKFFDTILAMFSPFLAFFASIGGLFVLAPFLSIIFFVTVLFWLIGIPPFITFFTLLGGTGFFLFMVVMDIKKASSYIFKQIFAVFGLITGRLFTSIIPIDRIKAAFYNAFNKINIPIDLSKPIDTLTSGMEKAFNAVCDAIGSLEKVINGIKKVIDDLLQPVKDLIKILDDIKNGVFGFFEDIGKAIANHLKNSAEYTANQMKEAANKCKQDANIRDPFGTIGSCGEAFGKGLLNSAGNFVAPVVEVAEDVGNAIVDTGEDVVEAVSSCVAIDQICVVIRNGKLQLVKIQDCNPGEWILTNNNFSRIIHIDNKYTQEIPMLKFHFISPNGLKQHITMDHHHMIYKYIDDKMNIVPAGTLKIGDKLMYIGNQLVEITDIENVNIIPYNILTGTGDININGIVATGFTTTTINLRKYNLTVYPIVTHFITESTQGIVDAFINTNKLTAQAI